MPWSAFDCGCNYNDDSRQEWIRSELLLALEKYGALKGLNMSQCLTMHGAASNRLTLVQGHPGTSKMAVTLACMLSAQAVPRISVLSSYSAASILPPPTTARGVAARYPPP